MNGGTEGRCRRSQLVDTLPAETARELGSGQSQRQLQQGKGFLRHSAMIQSQRFRQQEGVVVSVVVLCALCASVVNSPRPVYDSAPSLMNCRSTRCKIPPCR